MSGLIILLAAVSSSDCFVSIIIFDKSFNCLLLGDWSRPNGSEFDPVSIVLLLLENFIGIAEDWRVCVYFLRILDFEHVAS